MFSHQHPLSCQYLIFDFTSCSLPLKTLILLDYLMFFLLGGGERLLRYSDKSLTVIGSYLGFSLSSHFSCVFKKYAGCSPREYRERYT